MLIDFSEDRFKLVKENYSRWWSNDISRPLIWGAVVSRQPDIKRTPVGRFDQESFSDLSVSSKTLADGAIYNLACTTWFADGFPYVNFDISGPGIISAFLGAKLTSNAGRIWFEPLPKRGVLPDELQFDADNVWLVRLLEIYDEIILRSEGKVVLGLPDLGGTLDILAHLIGSENLLFSLSDEPELVNAFVERIHQLWLKYFSYIANYLKGRMPGYSDWSKAFYETPGYIIQSDFSYMISPAMFSEFVQDDLKDTIDQLDQTIYHLDGVGQLAHLDKLCSLKRLNAVQWIPGDGQPAADQWPDVLTKIRASGKSLHVYGNSTMLENIDKTTGDLSNLMMVWNWDDRYQTYDEISKYLQRYQHC